MNFVDLKNYIFLHSFINRPIFFNSLRYLVTGSQQNIKGFVEESLNQYHCQSVLDVCCGTGDFVQKSGLDYVGIDINPRFIAFAQKKYGSQKTKFIHGDALNLPFSSKKFDGSLVVSTLHHFSDNEARKLLAEIKRVTKKVVIIVDLLPCPSTFLKRFLVVLDQGSFVRTQKEKERLISKFFYIKSTRKLMAGLAEQYGMIVEINEKNY